MDTFEGSTFAEEQKELVFKECWDCGEEKMCTEYIVCCTGTKFYTCPSCKDKIKNKS